MSEWLDRVADFVNHGPQEMFPEESEELFLRPMRRSDVKAVTVVEEMAYEFPWSEATFRDCLRMDYHCWVGEYKRAVAAYGILTVAVGEAHILNLCVSPGIQSRGFGRRLLNHLVEDARRRDAETLFLEVRPSNKAARQLYHSVGFNEVGLRKGYYPARNGREDALLLALALAF